MQISSVDLIFLEGSNFKTLTSFATPKNEKYTMDEVPVAEGGIPALTMRARPPPLEIEEIPEVGSNESPLRSFHEYMWGEASVDGDPGQVRTSRAV